jgi:pimeloyl-ACP methyl ester carboxylesterase
MILSSLRSLLASLLFVLASSAAVSAPAASTPTRFSVETIGSGPDVILIPGLAASRDVWRGTAAALPGYRYHLIQVAGFAGAPARGNARGPVVAPLAEEIARYILERHLVRPAIVGHSMGGTIALMIAARHPDRVGKVMVVDMLPEPAALVGSNAAGIGGLADLLESLTGTPAGQGLVESAIRMFGDPSETSDPNVVARATNDLARTDLTPELARIAAQLTIVYASPEPGQGAMFDRQYRTAYAPARSARLVRIDRSGHMIMFDQPAAFRSALRRFLEG